MEGSSDSFSTTPAEELTAPVWHTVVLLGVFAALTVLGGLAQRRAHAPAASPRLVALQIQAIIFEWITFVWICFGVRRKGFRVRELVGGRWPNASAVLTDILLGAGLWVLWTGISRAESYLHRSVLDAVPYPANLLEGVLAVGVAFSAGVCEEIVFRGYLQRQFHALTKGASVAVLLQAVIFGLPHVYQGLRTAVMAALYGVLFGVLALWRRSLPPGILAHAWSDIAARLLRV